MKLYDSKMAPNPRRVRVFLAEKGIDVPTVGVDLGEKENQSDAFLAINPLGRVPGLELDDGTHLAETVAICRYFEGTQPDPALMGVDAKDRAVVEMWQRRMEFQVFENITALCGIDFGRITKIRIQPDQKNLARWHESVSARRSASA